MLLVCVYIYPGGSLSVELSKLPSRAVVKFTMLHFYNRMNCPNTEAFSATFDFASLDRLVRLRAVWLTIEARSYVMAAWNRQPTSDPGVLGTVSSF